MKPSWRLLILTALSLTLAHACFSQKLLRSSRNATLSAASLNKKVWKHFTGKYALPKAMHPVEIYSVRYTSPDWRGKARRLSGCVALPANGAPKGLVLFYHGTITDRRLSPSFYNGTQEGETELAVLAFATAGFAVACPDYIGLGGDPGAHPYPLASINGPSGLDLLPHARFIAERERIAIGVNDYVAGYSEGGACAYWAATQRTTFTAAAPMAGPYDLTGVTLDGLLKPTKAIQTYAAKLYLVSCLGYSASELFGLDLKDYFAPSFASHIPKVFKEQLTDKQRAQKLATKGVQIGAIGSINKALSGRFRKVLQDKNMSDPLMRMLERENLYQRAPQTKTLLVCLYSDQVVPWGNSYKALSWIHKAAYDQSFARLHVIRDKLDHITAAAPSMALARRFFLGGFAAVGTR
ncbi:MAG: alpha/beta hydrolase family protein [Fimbriimonadales bacterium]